MLIPPSLKPGDKVAIVCTARKFEPEQCLPAIELMDSMGLEVILGNTIGKDNFQLGGTDEERADDLQQMINRNDIKAIWIARGGYGTVRIIDKIDFTPLRNQPKWLIGFSDITVLHSHLHHLGLGSLHAIMPFSVPNATDEAKTSLKKALFGEELIYQTNAHSANIQGQVTGQLIGGNLSILYSLLGSASSVDTNGKILFIEDLDEYLYHIDRMMQNLRRNGYFEQLNGLVVGGMTDMHDNQIPFGYDAVQIISEIVKPYDIPVCFDFPAGHVPNNLALPFGREVSLNVGLNEVTLKFL